MQRSGAGDAARLSTEWNAARVVAAFLTLAGVLTAALPREAEACSPAVEYALEVLELRLVEEEIDGVAQPNREATATLTATTSEGLQARHQLDIDGKGEEIHACR